VTEHERAPGLREAGHIATGPPDGLPRYRILTGPDDDAFCHRVSEAIELGYELYGSPALTMNGQDVIAAQALLWPGYSQPPASDDRCASADRRTKGLR
jgi:hypothetical protein